MAKVCYTFFKKHDFNIADPITKQNYYQWRDNCWDEQRAATVLLDRGVTELTSALLEGRHGSSLGSPKSHDASLINARVGGWRAGEAQPLPRILFPQCPPAPSHTLQHHISILTKHERWCPFLTGRSGQFVRQNWSQEHAHGVPADRCPRSRWELPRAD